jgi:tellurium resistance protein TerD
MAIKLQKGGKFNLAKQAPSLRMAGIGLGWDPNESPGGPVIDLDVSAFMVGVNSKIPDESFLVFYGSDLKTPEGRPYSGDSSCLGAVDAIDGTESDGEDDEDMYLTFEKVREDIQQVVIAVSITKFPNDKNRDRRTLGLNFGMMKNCYIRCWNADSGEILFRYDLSKEFDHCDAVEFGRFYRVGDSWEFVASTGKGYSGSLQALVDLYT